MDRQETLKILASIKAAYPAFYRDMKKADAEAAVHLWEEILKDHRYEDVSAAVKVFIATDTKGYPPAPGMIIDKILQLTQPPQMTEGEAWGLVRKAMSNSAYHAQEEFEKLPEVVQRIVGSPNMLKEWALTDYADAQTVIQSNFMRSYRARAQSMREYLAMPSAVRELLGGLAAAKDMVAITDGN